MYPDTCSGMYKYIWYNPGSCPGSCNNGCDNSVGPAGSSNDDRANMVRNLGLDIRWRLLPSRNDTCSDQ